MSKNEEFKFDLNDDVTVEQSNARGVVRGRSDYANGAPDTYLVRHLDGQGTLVENWYEENVLS